MNPIELTALEATDAIAHGALSARELAQAQVEAVERLNPRLNALVRFDAEAALAAGRAMDAARARGERPGALAGAFATVKDNIWVADRPVSQGSALFADFVAPADALAVARLRAAGGSYLGTSNCSEFACKGVTTNRLFGATRNPWRLECTPGGSSGGAAAAVAAGLGQVALTTDGGGSTRRPAAHCGVVGLKPSAGLIPHPLGFAEPVFGNSVIGIMARSVADAAAVLEAVAGPDRRDPQCPPGDLGVAAASRLDAPLAGLRIAFSPRLGLDVAVDADAAAATRAAAAWLAEAGAELVDRDPPWPAGTSEEVLMPLQLGGLAALYGAQFRREPALFDPDIGAQIDKGLGLDAAAVAHALLHRAAMFRALAGFFAEVDLLLCPTTPCTAWPLEALGPATIEGRPASPRAHAVFTPAFNHTFLPACSVPAGLAANGLPLGVQLVGWRFDDARVLQAAACIERRTDPAFRRPRPLPQAAADD